MFQEIHGVPVPEIYEVTKFNPNNDRKSSNYHAMKTLNTSNTSMFSERVCPEWMERWGVSIQLKLLHKERNLELLHYNPINKRDFIQDNNSIQVRTISYTLRITGWRAMLVYPMSSESSAVGPRQLANGRRQDTVPSDIHRKPVK